MCAQFRARKGFWLALACAICVAFPALADVTETTSGAARTSTYVGVLGRGGVPLSGTVVDGGFVPNVSGSMSATLGLPDGGLPVIGPATNSELRASPLQFTVVDGGTLPISGAVTGAGGWMNFTAKTADGVTLVDLKATAAGQMTIAGDVDGGPIVGTATTEWTTTATCLGLACALNAPDGGYPCIDGGTGCSDHATLTRGQAYDVTLYDPAEKGVCASGGPLQARVVNTRAPPSSFSSGIGTRIISWLQPILLRPPSIVESDGGLSPPEMHCIPCAMPDSGWSPAIQFCPVSTSGQ